MCRFTAKIPYRVLCWLAVILSSSDSSSRAAGCDPEFCARLIAVPPTGALYVDARTEPAPVWAFTLQPAATGPGLRAENFTSPFGNAVSQQVASATFIGDFDPQEVGRKFFSLGPVLPPFPLASSPAPFFGTASYATTANDVERSFVIASILPGDFDLDRDVDSNDLLTVIGSWTGALTEPSATVDYRNGDVDFDFDVDSADLLAFLENWTGAAAMVALPEPSSGSAAVVVGLWALGARRRQRA